MKNLSKIVKYQKTTEKKTLNQSSINDIINKDNNNYLEPEKQPKIIKKYILLQEICANKFIIILDFILVYLFFIIVCIYIIVKYKTYSFLWFACIYGIIFAILNIIFYLRFRYIQPYKCVQYEERELNKFNKCDNKLETINTEKVLEEEQAEYSNGNSLNPNRSPDKKIYSNDNNIFNRYNDIEDEIKEAPSEEEETKKDKINAENEAGDNINNIILIMMIIIYIIIESMLQICKIFHLMIPKWMKI